VNIQTTQLPRSLVHGLEIQEREGEEEEKKRKRF